MISRVALAVWLPVTVTCMTSFGILSGQIGCGYKMVFLLEVLLTINQNNCVSKLNSRYELEKHQLNFVSGKQTKIDEKTMKILSNTSFDMFARRNYSQWYCYSIQRMHIGYCKKCFVKWFWNLIIPMETIISQALSALAEGTLVVRSKYSSV